MGKPYTREQIIKFVEEDTNCEYKLIHLEEKARDNGKRYMKIRHTLCNHEYTLDIYEFPQGKRRCGKCKGKVLQAQNTEDIEVIKQKTHDMTDGEYAFADDTYEGYKHVHNFFHEACSKTFEKSWDKFNNAGQRCTHCQKKGMESRASRHVRDILDHFNVPYIGEKRFDDCINPETGRVLPFDYYLPDINVIIEVDGEQHERGTFTNWDVSGVMQRDEIKNTYAKEKGIELVRIPTKEQRQLPNFLHAILSKELLKDLTIHEVRDVPQSSHPERINADLKKVHNGEYALHDNFYHGVEAEHDFIHLTCGNIFQKTLQSLRTEKYPCPDCREIQLKQDNHDKSNTLLIEKSNGKYCLDNSIIGIDEKGRRLVHCNTCDHRWFTTVGNLMKDTGGCPNCFEIQKDTNWKLNYDLVIKALQDGIKLDKKQKHWVWHNKRKFSEGKLKDDRVKLLLKANQNLL